MTHGMAGRIKRLQFDRFANFDDVTGLQASIHIRDLVLCFGVGKYLAACGVDHSLVATRVITVVMGIEDLSDFPAHFLGAIKHLIVFQRVNG